MNIDELTLGQIKTLKSMLSNEGSNLLQDFGPNIVVLQRGWVVVGYLSKAGTEYTLKNGAVVRVWGTENGLGEIAQNGPTKNTILDHIPESQFHELTTILIIKCDESKWKKDLK